MIGKGAGAARTDSTVAVTGGTGFIGRCLVNYLLDNNVRVRVLTRDPDAARGYWDERVEIWRGDLTSAETLSGFTDNVSTVFNVAGTIADPASFTAVNEVGTRNLLRACHGRPLQRFVHLSSVGVIGPPTEATIDERTVCSPANDYERSKLRGEQAVMDAWYRDQIPITVLRPTIVFGEGRDRARDSFASWMQAIQAGRFRFIGDGAYMANYVYVQDVVAACIHAASCDEAVGEIYIVSDSSPLREFVETAAGLMKVSAPSTIPFWMARPLAKAASLLQSVTGLAVPLTESRIRALTSTSRYSARKLREDLAFELPVGYREGLRRTIQWYRAQGVLAG